MAGRISYRVLTEEQLRFIFDAFAEGKTVIEISNALDIPRTLRQRRNIVYQRLKAAGITVAGSKNAVPRGARIRLPHAEILKLYREGLGAPAIAQRLGCGTTVINKLATRAGIIRPRFKGGRVINTAGYVQVRLKAKEKAYPTQHYKLEHRHVMEKHLGRPLEDHETIHHINGDKQDNRLENLQLRTGRHGKGVVQRCQDCGSFNVKAVPIAERDGEP